VVVPGIGRGDPAVRQSDLRASAGRDVDVEVKQVAVETPGAADRAPRADVPGVGPRQAATGPGFDDEAPVAGLVRAGGVDQADPGDVGVQEGDDRALAVVVERPLRPAVGVQPVSSSRSPGAGARRSTRWPSMRSAVIPLGRDHQSGPVVTVVELPSAGSTSSASSAGGVRQHARRIAETAAVRHG
jgi:hypothetical protein